MREKIVKSDLIECVLGLGRTFLQLPDGGVRRDLPHGQAAGAAGKILFINAVNEVTRERAQSFLTDAHIEKIVSAYRAFDDVDGFARVATNDEVVGKSANLSIPLYARPANGGMDSNGDGVSLQHAVAGWRGSWRHCAPRWMSCSRSSKVYRRPGAASDLTISQQRMENGEVRGCGEECEPDRA